MYRLLFILLLALPLTSYPQSLICKSDAYEAFGEQKNDAYLLTAIHAASGKKDTLWYMYVKGSTVTVRCTTDFISVMEASPREIYWYTFRYYPKPNDEAFLEQLIQSDSMRFRHLRTDSVSRKSWLAPGWKQVNSTTTFVAQTPPGMFTSQTQVTELHKAELIDALTLRQEVYLMTFQGTKIIEQIFKVNETGLGSRCVAHKTLAPKE